MVYSKDNATRPGEPRHSPLDAATHAALLRVRAVDDKRGKLSTPRNIRREEARVKVYAQETDEAAREADYCCNDTTQAKLLLRVVVATRAASKYWTQP